MELDVSHRALMDALFASPIEITELEQGPGVLVTWRFSTDVLRALRSTPGQTAAIVRQFFAPRAVALAQTFWIRNDGRGRREDDDPLMPDSRLSGWLDVDGTVLWRTSPEGWQASYRIVSRAYHEQFEKQFPPKNHVASNTA